MYATAVIGGSLLLGLLLLVLVLLLLPLWLLLEVAACLVKAESAGKLPLRRELSTRVPARIKDANVVTG